MRSRLLGALAVLAVATTACEQSQIDPDARIHIQGTVTSAEGRPAEGARVALSKEWDLGEGLVTVASLGLACLSDDVEAACGGSRVTDTDDDGSFAFELRGRDTQGFFGQASTLELSATTAPRDDEIVGPASVQRFRVQTDRVELPVRMWDAKLVFTTDRTQAATTWSRVGPDVLPTGSDAGGTTYAVVFRGLDSRPVWRFPRAKPGTTFDARLLEDTAGDVAVYADVPPVDVPVERGKGIDALLTSARLPYESRAGIPDSRGKTCSSLAPGGKPLERSPCPLTDGDFATTFTSDPEPCPTTCPTDEDEVVVDLEHALDVRLVTVRGCSSTCVIDTSGDAKTWARFGSGGPPGDGDRFDRPSFFAEDADDVAFRAPRSTRARYVRVTTDSLDTVREVSVFDPALPPEPQPGRAPAPGERSRSDATRWILVALGAALGLLAIVLILRARPRIRAKL